MVCVRTRASEASSVAYVLTLTLGFINFTQYAGDVYNVHIKYYQTQSIQDGLLRICPFDGD